MGAYLAFYTFETIKCYVYYLLENILLFVTRHISNRLLIIIAVKSDMPIYI